MILLLVLFFAVIEGSILSFPLTLVVLCALSFFQDERIRLAAFLSGIVLDIFTISTIGKTSLFFLLIIYLSALYQKKLNSQNIIYPLLFIIVTVTSYSLIFYRKINLTTIIFSVVMTACLLILAERFRHFSRV